MKRFMESFMENSKNIPSRVVLLDDANPKGITYGQVDQISGKVFAYLQSRGIGKEDFVMICLPRGIQPIIAMAGVWRNGSAFVMVEDNYAPERIEYIKNDCGCKLVIDSEVWEAIQEMDYRDGYVKTNDHDAAFAVYTSGTTGNPKGVVHEYGNIERMVESTDMITCPPLATEEDRFALVAPLNFVASLLITVYGLYYGIYNYVVSYSTLKNPISMGWFIVKNKITGTFLTPSYIRKMNKKPPMLKFCIIGSEPANDVYLDGLKIHNFYLMSESGFAVTHYLIDKKYEFTPVGKPEFDHEIFLLDENGNVVRDGEEGEVCFENEFSRGYLNLPEETEAAYYNGLYHSGDLARRDADGNLIICGRLNDMVKINGNRVEPGEIENVVKKVLDIDWAAARIFDDKKKVFICVYYTDNKIKVDPELTRKQMERYLPYYMLPSFFIHIDEVPLRPNGKMDRKALPAPDFSEYQEDFEAPRNEVEERLCQAFEEVLGIPRVGIKDDFYQMGGDSIGAMDILIKSGINGLSASDVFAGRTPEKIAAIWKEAFPDGERESDDVLNDRAIKVPHALSPYQTYMIDYQLYTPKSTMLNLFTLLKFRTDEYDIEKYARALEIAIANHPALCTRFYFNEDGEMMQKYEPEFKPHIKIEEMDADEFDVLKDALVFPFKIMNKCLYRCRVFNTGKYGYIFFDVHHTVFDGTSFQVLIRDIGKAYYDMTLDKDYYYLMLQEWEEEARGKRYLDAQEYFEKRYDGDDYCGLPEKDFESRENKLAHLALPMEHLEGKMMDAEKLLKVSRNAFFMTAAMLSIAVYNRNPNVKISWAYNGRDDLKKMSGVGLLLRDLPAALRLEKKQLMRDVYIDVQDQIANAIANSCYPYTTINAGVVKDDSVCFLYQEDIRNGGGLEELNIETVDIRQNRAAAENSLDLQVLDGKDGLSLLIDYSASLFDISSMERFSRIYITVCESMMHLAEDEKATVIDVIKDVQSYFGEREWWVRWMD